MPQLVPFFFINQVVFAFAIFVYVFSKYILPRFLRLFATRVFIRRIEIPWENEKYAGF